jgi:putative redox protein
MYAERKGWELASIEVEARYDVDDERHRAIKRTITVPADLTPEQREGLAEVAERTPVTLAIGGGTSITTTFNTRSTP